MERKLFWGVLLASIIGTTVLFEVIQRASIAVGQIPPRGAHELAGKPFLHYEHFLTHVVGDIMFLSFLNACVALALYRLEVSVKGLLWMVCVVLLAGVASYLWFTSVIAQFAQGKFGRWDWGFVPPGRPTIAGKAHLVYFWFEAVVIGLALFYLLWKPIGSWLKVGMIIALLGYASAAAYDAKKIGLSGGPFADPRKVEKSPLARKATEGTGGKYR